MLYGRTARDRFREPNLDGSFKRTTMLGTGVEKSTANENNNIDGEGEFEQQPRLRARLLNQES